jgi:hypothetical protein
MARKEGMTMVEARSEPGLVAVIILALLAIPASGIFSNGDDPLSQGPGYIDMAFSRSDYPAIGFVHLDGSATTDDVAIGLEGMGIEVMEPYRIIPVIEVRIPDVTVLARAAGMPGVGRIEASPSIAPMMDTSAKGVKAAASPEYSPDTAQDLGYTGRGVTIAFIDSGVDDEHPTFSGAFVAGADFTKPETPLTPRDGTFNPDDDNGHGTAVASIALGRGDPEGNYIGVAPGSGLIDLRVMGYGINPLADAGGNMVEALQWCVDHMNTPWNGSEYMGVGAISISFGIGPIDGAVAIAVQAAVDAGIPVVLAAGNTGGEYASQTQTSWPDGAIVVSGIDDKGTVTRDDDESWSGSTYGPRSDDGDSDVYDELKPDVSAPSVAVTTAQFSRFSNVQPASSWTEGSGTSFATPHVSGTVALMMESSDLSLTSDGNPVKLCLHQGAEALGNPYNADLSPKFDVHYGWGYLDAYEALKAARSYSGANSAPDLVRIEAVPNPVPRGSQCDVTIIASDPDEQVLEYTLNAEEGTVSGEGPAFTWTAPDRAGNFTLWGSVTDGVKTDESDIRIEVLAQAQNVPPLISMMKAAPDIVPVGGTSTITVVARDQDGDPLSYSYSTNLGEVIGTGDTVTFAAPDTPGDASVGVVVTDGRGGEARKDVVISVREDVQNSEPVIVLVVVTPSSVGAGSGIELLVWAQVEDPDGPQDIESVICDLSDIGMGSDAPMNDNGTSGDLVSGDGIFSIKVQGVGPLESGNHTLTVVAKDMRGGMYSARTYLNVKGSDQGTIEIGTSGLDPLMVIFIVLVAAVLLLSGIIIWVVVARNKARKRALGPAAVLQ